MRQNVGIHKNIIVYLVFFLLFITVGSASAQTTGVEANSIRLNQIGFYPLAAKKAIILTGHGKSFAVQTLGKQVVYKGSLKPSVNPSLSGKTTYIADFSALQKPGVYKLYVDGLGCSYPFTVKADVHKKVAEEVIKAYYFMRASTALPVKYAGKWSRVAGHPDDKVRIHPSAASDKRPAGTIISSPRGWYDAGDYNKYIVNSGISTNTLLSLYEDFPAYMNTVKLNIPESGNGMPDLLNEILWNLRWMLTMQDPNVMAQASRIFKKFPKQTPGLADSCLIASKAAWKWAAQNPNVIYDQDKINKQFTPQVTTGAYGDRYFTDEFIWAASELFVTTNDDSYLKNINLLPDERMLVPSWAEVKLLGYYTLLKNTNTKSPGDLPEIRKRLLHTADDLIKGVDDNAYQTSMTMNGKHFKWGSNSDAANEGVLLLQAYKLSHDKKYLDNALADLDYLLGRNATGYSYVTGYGTKTPMFPHHRPSASDGVTDPIPGLLVGGPNPGMQDGVKVPSIVPDEAYIDKTEAYAVNEITINWNAPIAYLANALEALQAELSQTKKSKSTK
jgi:endoglucanase